MYTILSRVAVVFFFPFGGEKKRKKKERKKGEKNNSRKVVSTRWRDAGSVAVGQQEAVPPKNMCAEDTPSELLRV